VKRSDCGESGERLAGGAGGRGGAEYRRGTLPHYHTNMASADSLSLDSTAGHSNVTIILRVLHKCLVNSTLPMFGVIVHDALSTA
jgi:hypothetical protein